MSKVKRIKNVLQEYSLPLIIGVVAGLVVANWNWECQWGKENEIGNIFGDTHMWVFFSRVTSINHGF